MHRSIVISTGRTPAGSAAQIGGTRPIFSMARRRTRPLGTRTAARRARTGLEGADYFDSQIPPNRGPEAVWQTFIEDNPWILGLSLGGQLLTNFDDRRLEQVVVGSSTAGPGKRADAVM